MIGTQLNDGERLLAQQQSVSGTPIALLRLPRVASNIAAARQDGGRSFPSTWSSCCCRCRDHARRAALPPLLAENAPERAGRPPPRRSSGASAAAFHQSAAGSATPCACCKVVVAVEVRTAQRNEQLALLQTAVSVLTLSTKIAVTCQMTADHRRESGQVQCAHAAPPWRCLTCAISLKENAVDRRSPW